MKKAIKIALAGAVISGVLCSASLVEASPYIVQKGDTLSKIAKAHNTTIQQLKQWNQLSGDQIYIAQSLVVTKLGSSNNGGTTNTASEEIKQNVQKSLSHKVIKGDTLSKIAKKYSTTVENIILWNNLKSDAIKVGQKLKINKDTDIIDEAPTANEVEAEINFKETADEAIEKQLNSEKTASLSISKANTELYTKALEIAKLAIDIPYKYGGNTIEGFDCSGFISYVYNNAGLKLERKSSLQYFEQDTQKVQQPLPGDIVFFKNTYIPTISHMGIYIGGDQFIHAGTKGITISNVNEKYWNERFVAYKRLSTVK
ncbi:NlpC/P60 family protein [Solibacillus sp. MA9]|uniref:NlpC/P60 family protein n=1 Tax=Solibacillus palustris TaxID=2908203 RepID=A0ABS9U8G1_9BACL|nr:C40 family peptidase [Solibacillus sp. MA9]MCH7320628.1 NlpC/P60 family protein [Solibacillus sp. MA9]